MWNTASESFADAASSKERHSRHDVQDFYGAENPCFGSFDGARWLQKIIRIIFDTLD